MNRKLRRQIDKNLREKGRGYTKPVLKRNRKFLELDVKFAILKRKLGL